MYTQHIASFNYSVLEQIFLRNFNISICFQCKSPANIQDLYTASGVLGLNSIFTLEATHIQAITSTTSPNASMHLLAQVTQIATSSTNLNRPIVFYTYTRLSDCVVTILKNKIKINVPELDEHYDELCTFGYIECSPAWY